MTGKKARVKIHGVVASTPMDYEYPGEYAFANDTHLVVYTDYTGNDITKCAIQANGDSMLLHRVGAFSGDMYFNPAYPTLVQYSADMLASEMVLHTQEYALMVKEKQVILDIRYWLSDPQGGNVIHGKQQIEVTWEEQEA